MTGPEFARNHHNDSADWSSADFETELNLAEIDAQVAYAFIAERLKAKTTTTDLTPAA